MINAKYVSDALGGKKSGIGYTAPCVAHDDANPSMSIADGKNGGIVVKCHAGCDQRELMHVLMARDLWPAPPEKKTGATKQIVASYDYTDADYKLVFQVVRYAPKDFRQRRPDEKGGWIWSMGDVERVPYRLPDVKDAIAAGETVFVCEGEKDCDNLANIGITATTSPAGAGKWPSYFAKHFVGAKVAVLPDNDQPGRQHARQVADAIRKDVSDVLILELPGLPPKGDVSDWLTAGGTREELLRLAEVAPKVATTPEDVQPKTQDTFGTGGHLRAGEVILQPLSEIEAKPISWLWPGRIARGKPTMIAGHPGLGKSQTTASLAAIVTTGGQWPVDRTTCEIGNVIILSAEDDPADTIRPRLEAAGADITRVHIIKSVFDNYDSAGDEVHRSFNLKIDTRRLEEAIAETGDVALVVIDPVSAYLGNGDSHNNSEMRGLLAPLSEMASRQNVAIVLVSHLNKGGVATEALMRVTGSLAFVAAARAAFIVAKDPQDEARRLFIPAKNNIAQDIGGLAFRIEGCSIGNGIETSRVMWEAAPVNVTADEILRQPADPEERDARDDAKAFLIDLLANGSVPAKDVFRDARDAGVSERTLRRAAQDLGVDKTKTAMDGGWLWKLAPKMAKGAEDVQPKTVATFGEVGHLRKGVDF